MKYFKMNDCLYTAKEPHVEKNVFLKMCAEKTDIPQFGDIQDKLPIPVWDGHEPTVGCYYKAWSLAWNNLRKPNAKAGFVSNYIDTAFNDYLFMWDSSFIVMFGKYAGRYFDFQKTLDNFYAHQHNDGFICRELCEYRNGEQFQEHDPASTGPNVLPWAEWEYYLSTGNRERLAMVFDPLCGYHNWHKLNRTWRDGTYWSCGLACGMDNTPRQESGYDCRISHGFMSWIDICAQQYFGAMILAEMGKILGREKEIKQYEEEAKMLYNIINTDMWDEKTAFYYDLYRNGKISGIKTVGSYWTLLAGLVPENRVERFVAHLINENEFNRPNRIPSLSADNDNYDPRGGYWRGGVWAPTNYMTLCGLHKYGYDGLAFEIARDYLKNVVSVYEKTGTLYENYSPESADLGYNDGIAAKKDFVGWTGLAPISILFEYIFGIRGNALKKEIIWDIWLTENHGIKQYPLGDATVDLICEARRDENEFPVIQVKADKPISIKVRCCGKESIFDNITEFIGKLK